MTGSKPDKLPRRIRNGGVTGVSVDPAAERPVTITVSGHDHRYEFAWCATPDGPIITDLRVMSDDETPITSDTLRKINTGRLAASAARADTPAAAEVGRELRELIEGITDRQLVDSNPATVVEGGLQWLLETSPNDPAVAQFVRKLRGLDPGEVLAAAGAGVEAARIVPETLAAAQAAVNPGKAGRPRLSRERLREVAEWARTARDRGVNVYEYVAEAATAADNLRHPYGDQAAKKWVRRAKAEGLLGPDELGRKPRNDDRGGR